MTVSFAASTFNVNLGSLALATASHTMNYNSAIGALLVGCVVGAYLFGINTSQAWVYLRYDITTVVFALMR